MSTTVRLAHLSDVHVTAEPLGWRHRDWFNKRLTGWLNLRCAGRGQSFAAADEVLSVLTADLRGERRPDHLIFSGDATALGFPAEMARAARALRVGDAAMPPALAVPGNHDYYTPGAEASGCFEKHFGAWQHGERVDDEVYPFAQRAGSLWLVGVNACTGNRWPGDATGRVGAAQIGRLRRLLERLEGPRILITHYPVCRPDGRPERRSHWLHDLDAMLAVADRGGVALWFHGHQHQAYHVSDPRVAPFPIVCVGSSTQRGRWSYHEYVIDGLQVEAVRRTFDPEVRRFRETSTFAVRLRG
jgi:3',5'-cyclic AMP phosphodiesterase CpdA